MIKYTWIYIYYLYGHWLLKLLLDFFYFSVYKSEVGKGWWWAASGEWRAASGEWCVFKNLYSARSLSRPPRKPKLNVGGILHRLSRCIKQLVGVVDCRPQWRSCSSHSLFHSNPSMPMNKTTPFSFPVLLPGDNLLQIKSWLKTFAFGLCPKIQIHDINVGLLLSCSGKTSLLLQFAINCASQSQNGHVVFMCNKKKLESKPPFLSKVCLFFCTPTSGLVLFAMS